MKVDRVRTWCRRCVLIVVMAGMAHLATAQGTTQSPPSVEDMIIERLVAQGFEHVGVDTDGARLIVSYENRIYRYEVRAMQEVIKTVMSQQRARGHELLTVVPFSRGIPVIALTVPVAAYREFVSGVATAEAFAGAMTVEVRPDRHVDEVTARRNPTYFKAEVVIHPQIEAEFGNFVDPVAMQANVVPELRTSLWKGMLLTGQVVLPVYNELSREDDYVRPGIVAFNQVVRWPANLFTSFTVGYFVPNRYGLYVEAEKYLVDGRVVVGASLGRTGYAEYWKGEWLYGDINTTTYETRLRWYLLPEYRLAVEATYGQFVFHDTAFRFDVTRAFGEFDVGFFGVASGAGANTGFTVSVPLPGQRYMRPRRARVRQASSVAWEYRFRRLVESGHRLDTGYPLGSVLNDVEPAFMARRLAELPGWVGGR